MSENPTARFVTTATPYELYENFQIDLSSVGKRISEFGGENVVELKSFLLLKMDCFSDIMESM
jgi:hypothetical protein